MDLLSWVRVRRGCHDAASFLRDKTPSEAFIQTDRADWLLWSLAALDAPDRVLHSAFFASVREALEAVQPFPAGDVVLEWATRVLADPPARLADLNGPIVALGRVLMLALPDVPPDRRGLVETVSTGVLSFTRQSVKLTLLRTEHGGVLPAAADPLIAQLAQNVGKTTEACCTLRDGGVYSPRVLAAARAAIPTDFDAESFADRVVSEARG